MSGSGGPVVVVGGGAAGLGRAIVDALLASGARVVVPARTEAVAERLYLDVEPEHVPSLRAAVGDPADPATLGRIAAVARREFGGIDHLVTALDADPAGPLAALAEADVHRALATAVTAPGTLILGLLRHLNGAAPVKRVVALTAAPADGRAADAWALGRAFGEGLIELLRQSGRPGLEAYALRAPLPAGDRDAESARVATAVVRLLARGAGAAVVDAGALAT